jgi:NADPH:quinone reductase-like Zn-dependent oxidoreductase
MKAFIVDRYKSKDGLRFGDRPDPELRDEDVMVQVHAASVNPLDPKIRDGEFKFILPYRLPLVLGNDLAGVVVRVGPKVRGFKPGDKVYARPNQDRIGTFAEFISMNEADVALKPKNLTMEEAASIPLVGLTAWQVLVERANLKKGQKVLIHAGSGGWERSQFSWRSILARRSRRQRAPRMSIWSRVWVPISSSITRRTISRKS